ncbi:MAG: MopE-related protein, partial [Myxococcota bacterium]
CDEVEWFLDADGDGVGSALAGMACEAPEGAVRSDGDCDDVDATVFPGADDPCGDTIDQDCDGDDPVCREDAVYDVETDADATFLGVSTQWFGYQIASGGDVDGDGVDDLLVESSYASRSSGGGGSGREMSMTMIYGDAFAEGESSAGRYAEQWSNTSKYDMEVRADFDGDGVNDVVWTGYDTRWRSVAEITWGYEMRWTDGADTTPDVALVATDYFGRNLTTGDADGDGLSDLFAAHGNAAVVVYGDKTRFTERSVEPDPMFTTEVRWFGGGDLAIGDLDGDGLGDFVFADVYDSYTDTDQPGAFHVIYSDGRLTDDVALPDGTDAIVRGPTGYGLVYMGYRLAAGDLDGDGYGEVAAGAHSYDASHGMVWVFGGTSGRWSGAYDTGDATASVYGESALAMGVAVEITPDI